MVCFLCRNHFCASVSVYFRCCARRSQSTDQQLENLNYRLLEKNSELEKARAQLDEIRVKMQKSASRGAKSILTANGFTNKEAVRSALRNLIDAYDIPTQVVTEDGTELVAGLKEKLQVAIDYVGGVV